VEKMLVEKDIAKLVKRMVKVAAKVRATHILVAEKPGVFQGYATSHPDLTADQAVKEGFKSVRRFTAAGGAL
jgi:hypothetical protein